MVEHSSKALLRSYLKGEVDERLFEYVAANANHVAWYSMEQLCEKTNASPEELYRLFNAFGVDSLLSFKEIVRNLLYYEGNDNGITKRSIRSIADEIFRYETKNISDLADKLDYEQLNRLAEDILNSPEVIVCGSRVAKFYGWNLVRLLNKIGIKAHLLEGPWEENACGFLNTVDSSPLVIAFGVCRYHKNDVLMLRQLKDRGFHIVGFTDTKTSPFALLSDYYFIFPMLSFDFLDSCTGCITLINLLIICIGLHDDKKMIAQINAQYSSCEEMGMFF